MKILVVDDDPIVTKITEARLKDAGHDVVVRTRPMGTAFAIADEKPDVLLLDLNMPLLDGETIASLVRTHNVADKIRIIFHSALPEDELAKRALGARVAGYILKTGNDSEFMAKFNSLVNFPARAR